MRLFLWKRRCGEAASIEMKRSEIEIVVSTSDNEAQRKFSSLGSTVVYDSVSPISENNFRTKLEKTSLSAQCFRWRCV